MRIYKKAVLFIALLALVSCTSTSPKSSSVSSQKRYKRNIASLADDAGLEKLPELRDTKKIRAIILKHIKKGRTLTKEQANTMADKIAKYAAFLDIDPTDTKVKTIERTIKETGEKRVIKVTQKALYTKVITRLFNSSTQFILCDRFGDWECLEKSPDLMPTSIWRQDTRDDLGNPIIVDEPLKLKYFFTEAWDKPEEEVDRSQMLAVRLGEIIDSKKWDEIALNIYGIDDIEDSMKPVFEAIKNQKDAGADVRGVVDIGAFDPVSKAFPYLFSHIPFNSENATVYSLNTKARTNIDFEYGASIELMKMLNEGITTDDEAKGRWEMPNSGIMHNKYFVFNKDGKRSVWTGTANIARTCMGTERNTNMGVYIESDEIANSFLAEFEEMYTYQPSLYKDEKGRFLNKSGKPGVFAGRFHYNKRPNTQRYFQFNDGNEVRINFSPTDDAEHRIIIPMLLSAQPGDQIRVAMYGGGGYEYVRAFQYAVAQGADVRIVFDRLTGANGASWINNLEANLRDPNPYNPKAMGSVIVRMSTWQKLNHHKSATLTRVVDGQEHVEMIVFGSQNWSQVGNDKNDENVVAIRNLNKDVPIGKDYNKHFDERLWPVAEAGTVNLKEPPGGVDAPEEEE